MGVTLAGEERSVCFYFGIRKTMLALPANGKQMIKFSWRQNYLFPLAGFFLFLTLLESVSFVRLTVVALEASHEISVTEGIFRKVSLPKYRGWGMRVVSGAQDVEFSCELPGIREFSACFKDESFMNGSQVRVVWFRSPANIFSGQVRHPIRVEFLPAGKVINIGFSPHTIILNAVFNKLVDILILIIIYTAFYFLINKLIALGKR